MAGEGTKICRFCLLNDSNEVVNIFSGDHENFTAKVLRCTNLQLREDDEIPPTVCRKCIDLINIFDTFLENCRRSQIILQNKLQPNVIETVMQYCVQQNCFRGAWDELSQDNNSSIESSTIQLRKTKSDSDITHTLYKSPNFDDNCDRNTSSDLEFEANINSDKSPQALQPSLRTGKRHSLHNDEKKKVRIYEIDKNMKKIIGDNKYVCEICMFEFNSFFEYYDHQDVHNGNFLFRCSKCPKVFCERTQLVEHDAKHKIPCKICNAEVLPKSMPAHLLIHTDTHKCSKCGMRHTSSASLMKHFKARHAGIKGFVCHICGKQSSCQSSLNRHMAYHSNDRPFKCKHCEFTAKSVNIVQVHTSRIHCAEKCVCEICAKIFKSQPSLMQHMKRIHSPRKHACNVCSKTFNEKYNLNKHLKKHAKYRIHECKVCLKEFFTVRKLKEHMHTHRQGVVNCHNCGKQFFYKKYLDKHVNKCVGKSKNK